MCVLLIFDLKFVRPTTPGETAPACLKFDCRNTSGGYP